MSVRGGTRDFVDRVKDGWGGLSPLARIGGAVGGLACAALIVALALGAFSSEQDPAPEVEPGDVVAIGRGSVDDPLEFDPELISEFEQRGAGASADVLHEKSPAGVIASAERTERFRAEIESAAAEVGADPDLMEAMVFLESAGRPEVIAGDDPSAASGLAQIVASTGIALLDMEIDLTRSQELTAAIAGIPSRAEALESERRRLARQIQREERKLDDAKRKRRVKAERAIASFEHDRTRAARALEDLPAEERSMRRERRTIDPRFDPEQALAGMARYLEIAEERFGRQDLAIASYHMGIGNLEDVIRRYVRPGDSDGPIGPIVEREDLSFAELYYGSSPTQNPRTWALIDSFGDDSATYLWRVLASERIMNAYRSDPEELTALTELHLAKSSAEEVFHPEADTQVFADAGEIRTARADESLVPLPRGKAVDFRTAKQLGELAKDLGVKRELYRALRPEALAALIYMSSRVRAITGRGDERLTVTSAVRDREYQDRLVQRNPQATPEYSLHTTGWAFDIWRRYDSDRQAAAFQFVLDRMRSLGVIDYAIEPEAIHIVVSDEAATLLESE
ncbi:MAG: DUF5715 family protein [Solirubrobacterales bacterium]